MPMRKKHTPVVCKYPKIQELGYNVPPRFCYIFDTAGRISTFRDYDVLRRSFRAFTTGENFWDTYNDWDDEYLLRDWEEYLMCRFESNGIPTAQLLRSLSYMDLDWICGQWAFLHKGEELHERVKPPTPGECPQRFIEAAEAISASVQLALFPLPMVAALPSRKNNEKPGNVSIASHSS